MSIRLKRLVIVSSLASGILVGSFFFPRPAFAPHEEWEEYKGKKKTGKGLVYASCPHCGKKIKLHLKVHVGKP